MAPPYRKPGATDTTYRLYIAIDLISLSIRQVEVTTGKVGENPDHYQLDEGDVVLVDRGYNQPETLVPFLDRGGEVVLRYNAHSMNVYEINTEDGSEAGREPMIKVDRESRLQTLNRRPGYFPVCLCHDGQRIQVFLHSMPLPPAKAAEARRQAKKRAKKKGRAAREKTLYLSEWVLVLTSLPPALVSRRMLEKRVSGFPVIENDKLVGIITEGDLLSALGLPARSPQTFTNTKSYRRLETASDSCNR